ncbi:hypothetical protein GCM10027614_61080 [Micromonospora vulcania]
MTTGGAFRPALPFLAPAPATAGAGTRKGLGGWFRPSDRASGTIGCNDPRPATDTVRRAHRVGRINRS